uniref:Transmembrane protein n=1 Tax=Rhizophora mucronata TaxID=61149 RepID=A0A2P2QSI6_RHIMU
MNILREEMDGSLVSPQCFGFFGAGHSTVCDNFLFIVLSRASCFCSGELLLVVLSLLGRCDFTDVFLFVSFVLVLFSGFLGVC